MELIQNILNEIWLITVDMSPFLILGFIIAGILHVYIPKDFLSKHLGKPGIVSSIKAALIGVPLPLCSCGVIPTGISLKKNGAQNGATNSFLISTPQTGIDSILITSSLMNIYWAIARPIIALITGVLGGVLTDKLVKPENIIEENKTIATLIKEEKKLTPYQKIKELFNYSFIEFLSDISRQLIIGVLLAAIITTLVPATFFETQMNSPLLNMLLILVASIPLYVCATGSVPIAASLLTIGVTPGAVLVFLMAGPATNIATLTVLWKSLGKKTTLIYLFSIIFGALFFGILIDYVFDNSHFNLIPQLNKTHVHGVNNWIGIISSIILIGLIIFVELRKLNLFKTNNQNTTMENTYIVEGMTCNHCKNNVETNLEKIDSITSASVDLNSKTVHLEGEINEALIQETINDLGYKFIGKK